jgi:hypothetical protein
MSEVEFFLLTRVLTQNSDAVEFIKFLKENQRLCIQIVGVTLKMASYRTMSQKKKVKKLKIQVLWVKQTSFMAPYLLALGQF